MAEKGKSKPKRQGLIWDNQETHDETEELAGLVLFTEDSRAAAGQALIQSAHRWPDTSHLETVDRKITHLPQDKRELIQRIATQVIELMPLVIEGEVTSSGDTSFHLEVSRSGATYTIDLEVPTIIGEKGDTGEKGDKGDTGDTGAQGETGATGATGADGADCEDCGEGIKDVPTPPTPEGKTDDEIACNAAEGLAQVLRSNVLLIHTQLAGDVLAADIIGVVLSAIAAFITGGVALAAAIAAVAALVAFILTNADESTTVLGDDTFWQHVRCDLYCCLTPSKDVNEDTIACMQAALRADTYVSGSFDAPDWFDALADLFDGLPVGYFRQYAYIGSLNDADCSECDCPTDCNLDSWSVWNGAENYGTEISRDANSITLDLDLAGATVGEYFLRMKTAGGVSDCCHIDSVEVISGGTINVRRFKICGGAQDGTMDTDLLLDTGTNDHNANSFYIGSSGACRVKITFSGVV